MGQEGKSDKQIPTGRKDTYCFYSWLAAYPQFFGRLARLAQKTNDEENYTIFDSIKTIAKGGNQNRVVNNAKLT